MTAHQLVTRFALMTCTALGCWTLSAPAQAQVNIPTGAPRSPLLHGATPFSQKLLIYEEFGLQSLPATDSGARLRNTARIRASSSCVEKGLVM